MCGINAVFDPRHRYPDKGLRVQQMNRQMVYRGPDDEGVFLGSDVALGMRRLSIIDVAGGRQPVYNEDGSIVIVFNGEIYNYMELMHDLQARGHQFQSQSDTETIIHLYEEKGERCLEDLRGMFAFVLWDGARQRLFAARDRVGIKPLYFSQQDGVLWLSSELKAIVGAAEISPTLRAEAVYQFLLYGYAVDQRHTVVEDVKRLLPGEYLLADADTVMFRRYWTPQFGGEAGLATHSDQEIREILETAIRIHLRSDVPVGILLSSGIDSSAIAAFAAQSHTNYTAICAGYAGTQVVDERPQAHEIARFLGLPYVDVILDERNYAACFDKLTQYVDEPLGDRAAMPQWMLYEQGRELGYKVLLTGNGGDEVFLGYPRWNAIASETVGLGSEAIASWTGFNHTKEYTNSLTLLRSMATEPFMAVAAESDHCLYELRDAAPRGPDAMSSIVFGTYLVHNGCFLADKLAMGSSVEVRVPLLDHVLIDAVFGLPLPARFQTPGSKPLLRRILKPILPAWVLTAPKRGFTPPIRYLDTMVAAQADQIMNGTLTNEMLDRRSVEVILRQQRALPWIRSQRIRSRLGMARQSEFLFRLLAFERWANQVLG